MLNKVKISDELLEITNTKIPFLSDEPDRFGVLLVVGFLASLLGLAGCLIYRLTRAEDIGKELAALRSSLARAFQSTLITRLCLLWAALVIPLIFYVNTKEHYWTAKHTTMLFSCTVGLFAWLAVWGKVPRFRIPYRWPVSIFFFAATVSMFVAVNLAEGSGYLFAYTGAVIFLFLSSQVLTTSKRIHLFVVTVICAATCVSIYGLAQAYLLLPMEHVFAQDTRAPVSTLGNKNYAAYVLDLAIPLTFALAVTRRNPLQTLLLLGVYFICRWHFVLCDTRGGTIAMTLGIILTSIIVAVFHGRRFRLLLYLFVLEPLLWGAMNAASIIYSDAQEWGKTLLGPKGRMAIGSALSQTMKDAPESLHGYASHIRSWFDRSNEVYLGVDHRLLALIGGFLLGLILFWVLLKIRDNWRTHLAGAAILALLPYLLAVSTMPGAQPVSEVASRLVDALAASDMEPGQREVAVEIFQQFARPMAEAASEYNRIFQDTHRNVAAMFSLTLFVCMAIFLLFRWYDRDDGWLPGFGVVGALGGWFLLFLGLCSGGGLPSRLMGGLFARLDHAWPVDLSNLHGDGSLIGLLFTVFCFVAFTLLGLSALIATMQYIPAHYSNEESQRMAKSAIRFGKIALPVVLLLAIVGLQFHPRIARSRADFFETLRDKEEGTLSLAFFNGLHTFFNTRAEFDDQTPDGAIGFRLEIYQGSLRKVLDNPILGIGTGNYKVLNPHPRYETALERRILGKEVLGRHAHNDFLERWVENGVLGLLSFIWIFAIVGTLLYRSLKSIRPPETSTEAFLNTITWGLSWAMISILIHSQFEYPLLQPASAFLTWMLFGVIFQLYRIRRRRNFIRERIETSVPTVAPCPEGTALPGGEPLPLASYELPTPVPPEPFVERWSRPWIAWPAVAVVVTLLFGTVLIRQFVGEMWLRWGMLFSEAGIEKFGLIFQSMKKASEVYPQQMETNYILGRYCIDATSKVFGAWRVKNRPDLFPEADQIKNADTIRRLREVYQLDVDKIFDYADLGMKAHIRDIYMNPHYKWAHNNMGVLCDKLAQINEELAAAEIDPDKKREHEATVRSYEEQSKNCYLKALEVDDLQVYALFNLGVGAFRDRKMGLAEKYFERTLLADPRRGDVNSFLARCRFAQQDLEGVLDAARSFFVWVDKSPKSRFDGRDEKAELENMVSDLESILTQTARAGMAQGAGEIARGAAEILVERYDRCSYLSLLSLALLSEGNSKAALDRANECLNGCSEPISAECVFAHAKANCVLGDATTALNSAFLLLESNAADSLRPLLAKDPAFDLIRQDERFEALMGVESANPPAPASP